MESLLYCNNQKMLSSNVLSHALKAKYESVDPNPTRELSGHFPIHDLTAIRSKGTSNDAEDLLRCKLAATCRLISKYKFTFGIYNHVTVRSPENRASFLINPFGLNFHEVTASSLIKVDSVGNVKLKGSTPFGISKAGFILHSAVHAARPDINCVLHVHTHAGIAVSSLKKGLMPLSQEALLAMPNVSYHTYDGVLNEEAASKAIAASLGPKNKVLILHNHGVVSCGATVEEAWSQLFNIIYACKTQCLTLACVDGDFSELIMPDEIAMQQVKEASTKEQYGLNSGSDIQWSVGEMEFEAEMRCLEAQGLNTGYPFKVKKLIES